MPFGFGAAQRSFGRAGRDLGHVSVGGGRGPWAYLLATVVPPPCHTAGLSRDDEITLPFFLAKY